MSETSPAPTKKCPFCAEDIQAAAIKCKHCGSMVAPLAATQPTTETAPQLTRRTSLRVPLMAGAAIVVAAVVVMAASGDKAPSGVGVAAPRNGEQIPALRSDQGGGAAGGPRGNPWHAQPPDDPLPPTAHKAGEVPALEARIADDAAYRDLWEPAHRRDLTLLLSAISQALATDTGSTFEIDQPATKELERLHLYAPTVTLMMIFARVGRFPGEFEQHFRALLADVRALPHLGVWGAAGEASGPFDIAVLAAWTMKDQPEYLRELLAARRAQRSWPKVDGPLLPYLATERGALERLALLGALTEGERARLDELNATAIDAVTLWRKYDANEVAADNELKGKRLRVTGTVQSIDKDFTDSIVLLLASPNEFMPTHANLKDAEARRAAALRKGAAVTLTCVCMGRVMGSPVLDDCTL